MALFLFTGINLLRPFFLALRASVSVDAGVVIVVPPLLWDSILGGHICK